MKRTTIVTLALFTVSCFLGVGCSSDSDKNDNNYYFGGNGDTPDIENPHGLSTNACGKLPTKVVNGSACGDDESTPVVWFTTFRRDQGPSLCSGTLLTPSHVLTASHCFLDENGNPITDAGGRIRAVDVVVVEDTKDGPQTVLVQGKNTYIHPQAEYGQASVLYDLAIIELERPVNAPTLPIVVSRQSAPNFKAELYGYGLDEDQQFGQLKSGEAWVNVVTQFVIYTEFEGAGSTICSGDSGGPLTRDVDAGLGVIGVSSGILSEGGTCGQNFQGGDSPIIGAFTNVQDPVALNFITSKAPGTRTI